jgi:four helix bundle protein
MENQTHTFPHRKLDAWKLAKQARRQTLDLLGHLPTGFGDDARQARRSSGGVVRLIAEGGDRWARGDKRRRFEEALAEVGETVATLDDLADLGALDRTQVDAVLSIWGRVGATTYGLVRRHR